MLINEFEKILKIKPEGEALYQKLKDIKRKTEPLLLRIIETFPEYTYPSLSARKTARHRNRLLHL